MSTTDLSELRKAVSRAAYRVINGSVADVNQRQVENLKKKCEELGLVRQIKELQKVTHRLEMDELYRQRMEERLNQLISQGMKIGSRAIHCSYDSGPNSGVVSHIDSTKLEIRVKRDSSPHYNSPTVPSNVILIPCENYLEIWSARMQELVFEGLCLGSEVIYEELGMQMSATVTSMNATIGDIIIKREDDPKCSYVVNPLFVRLSKKN